MELFFLRKICKICPRHRGPGPPAPAHGSTDFIKHWSLATGSTARIKPIESATRSDNSTKFKNTQVENFLDEEDIKHEFLAIYTPQQNGVAKRKNHTLIEMARSMLDEYKTSDRFWVKAINMACHATNRLYLRKLLKKTSYKLLTGNKPNVSYFLFLEVSDMFYIRGKSFLNLLLKFMRVSCLVMIQILAHTVFLM
jgi:transposase InsO family protein